MSSGSSSKSGPSFIAPAANLRRDGEPCSVISCMHFIPLVILREPLGDREDPPEPALSEAPAERGGEAADPPVESIHRN